MTTVKHPYPWTVLVVTCPTSEAALAVKREVSLLQKRKVIHEVTVCLSVEDPEKNVGSGGATLNALLVAVEHVCATRGLNVLNNDVLLDSTILIFHNGRPSFLEVCGKGFLSVPMDGSDGLSKTNLEHTLGIVGELAAGAPGSGVWVCSTDMLLIPKSGFVGSVAFPPTDCVLFSTLASPLYGTKHGVLELLSNSGEGRAEWSSVADIHYCRPIQEVQTLVLKDEDSVPLVCGIVYLSALLSEALLSLHTRTPLSSCTYLGLDSGATPVQISLFFDILTAMCGNISKESFVAGDCGKSYGTTHSYVQNERTLKVRELVWNKLSRFRIGAVIVPDLIHSYVSDDTTVRDHLALLQSCRDGVRPEARIDRRVLINSLCDDGVFSEDSPASNASVIRHCLLRSVEGRTVRLGNGSLLSGIDLDLHSKERTLVVGDNVALMVFRIRHEDSNDAGFVPVLFGTEDRLKTPCSEPGSTFCQVSWQDFFGRTGIAAADIWESSMDDGQKCLFNARLFPIDGSVEDSLWLGQQDGHPEQHLNGWREMNRICLRDILNCSEPSDEFHYRREVSHAIAIHQIRKALTENGEISLDPLFRRAVVEGWSDRLLDVLDELAAACDGQFWNPGRAARILGNVANLLGCLADGQGGLRSGPAANKDWAKAYQQLENNAGGGIREAVAALREARSKWMPMGPHWLIRAARHYEGAAQILVRHAVFTSKLSLPASKLSFSAGQDPAPIPPIGVWVSCDCPARIDLFGGWTDTPPICYELGGSVVNASILVDGKCPIGAKIRRCAESGLRLYLDEGVKVTLGHPTDLLDYNQPTSLGSLAKACIMFTRNMDTELNLTTDDFQGPGYELHTWSDLPQGSGLGTSSIMAGAIIAVLWTVKGISYDKNALIHGVLCVEQMLTTGGGWQDQVGGLTGGFAHGQTLPQLPLRVTVEKLDLRREFVDRLQRHLVLVYTGKIRLAKNLLQNVLRNWFSRDAAMLGTFQNLREKSFAFLEALKEENLPKIGESMNEYWRLKKLLAPGAEPAGIAALMKALSPHSYGQLLCGAGGGGFMVVLVKDADDQSVVDDIIAEAEKSGVSRYSVAIDTDGINVKIGEERVTVV